MKDVRKLHDNKSSNFEIVFTDLATCLGLTVSLQQLDLASLPNISSNGIARSDMGLEGDPSPNRCPMMVWTRLRLKLKTRLSILTAFRGIDTREACKKAVCHILTPAFNASKRKGRW